MRNALMLAAAILLIAARGAAAQEATIETSYGTITVTLDAAHAPQTVANFVAYAREGHFDGTVVYRVVPGFVIQAGSTEASGGSRPVHAPIALETASGLKNLRGTIAMARSSDPTSATAEFFINLSDNPDLDPHPGEAPNTSGYAVFGTVSGMDVVDRIATVPTGGTTGPFPPDASPAMPVTIIKVTIVDAAAPSTPPAPAN